MAQKVTFFSPITRWILTSLSCGNRLFFQRFPVFAPSLSWQNGRFAMKMS